MRYVNYLLTCLLAEWRDRRPGRSTTRLSGPRYCGASPCKILYAWTAILHWTRAASADWQTNTLVMWSDRRRYVSHAAAFSSDWSPRVR